MQIQMIGALRPLRTLAKASPYVFFTISLFLNSLSLYAGASHGHEESGAADESQHQHLSNSVHLSAELAQQVGIQTTAAASKRLQQSITSYGVLAAGAEQLSHVRARYSGIVIRVAKSVGDTVKRGELLAEVESSETLVTYRILAPIGGTVIQRHANTGEVTQDQVLFSIANFNSLWAELRVYPNQLTLVKAGQTVHIEINGQQVETTIAHIIPAIGEPYQLARARLDNTNERFSPGLMVAGQVVVDVFDTKLAVKKQALQQIEGEIGVFVQQGQRYTFTPLQLGRKDHRYVEVIAGLEPEQLYVSANSYLMKADIEKSAAEHSH